MKRAIVLLLALIALTAVYLHGHSQQPSARRPPRQTRIGAVNMGAIYLGYNEVAKLKSQLDDEMQPFTRKKQSLEQAMQEWKAIVASKEENYSPETREMGVRVLVETQRQLEDLDVQVKKVIKSWARRSKPCWS